MADFGAYGYPSMMPPAQKRPVRPGPVGPPVRQAALGGQKSGPAYGGAGATSSGPYGATKRKKTPAPPFQPPTMPGKPLPQGDPMAQSAGMKVGPAPLGPPVAQPGGGAPPFQPPGMGGTAGRGMVGPPVVGGGGPPKLGPRAPMPSTTLPPAPGGPNGGGGGGMMGGGGIEPPGTAGGGWVDAEYGTGPLNAQGFQWRPFDFTG